MRKAPAADPEGPAEGSGEAPEKAPREAVAECCGTVWYSLNAWDAHSRSRNHRTSPPSTPRKGVERAEYDVESDPEVVAKKKELRLKRIQDELDGGPSRSRDDGLHEELRELKDELRELRRSREDGGHRQERDPIVEALLRKVIEAPPAASVFPTDLQRKIDEIAMLQRADSTTKQMSGFAEFVNEKIKALDQKIEQRVQPPMRTEAHEQDMLMLSKGFDTLSAAVGRMQNSVDETKTLLRPVAQTTLQAVGKIAERAIYGPQPEGERSLSDADREMGERALGDLELPPEDAALPPKNTTKEL